MNILRFACGAVSPPFEGSFEEWVQAQIKDLKGYALGRRKDDGRLRVMVFDLNGGITTPRMPNGDRAPCLNCPCVGESGRKELRGVPIDPRHGRRIVVTCYPSEACASCGKYVYPTGKHACATPDVAPATPRVAEIVECFRHGLYEGLDCPMCAEERAKIERERSEK